MPSLAEGIQAALSKAQVEASALEHLNLDGKVKANTLEVGMRPGGTISGNDPGATWCLSGAPGPPRPPQGLEELTSLQSLSLSCCGLRKLAPGLPASLAQLVVSDNQISSGLEALSTLTSLRHLDIAGNRFSKLEQLAPLAALPQLRHLDTEGCPVETMPDYRARVFEMLAGLEVLSGLDKAGNGEGPGILNGGHLPWSLAQGQCTSGVFGALPCSWAAPGLVAWPHGGRAGCT